MCLPTIPELRDRGVRPERLTRRGTEYHLHASPEGRLQFSVRAPDGYMWPRPGDLRRDPARSRFATSLHVTIPRFPSDDHSDTQTHTTL